MKLIELSSNKASFKTVKFNESGISLIIAEQEKPEENDINKTYNGVGKSLIVLLINFCLGAKKKHYESFIKKMPDWIFYLTIKINNEYFCLKRSMSEATKIYINDEPPLTIDNFNSIFKEKLFDIPRETKFLTFRSLISFFLRPLKKNYVNADEPTYFHTPYKKLLSNGFLLGLDLNLIQDKYLLREEQTRIEKLEKNIKNDDLLKEFFNNDKDVNLEIQDIEDKIEKLKRDKDNYEVAEDYYEVKIEADKIEKELSRKHNEIVLFQNQISNITDSLNITPDLSKESIEKVYQEVNIFFSESVNKTLVDLESFYTQLTENRVNKLNTHKQIIKKKLKENLDKELELKKELDNKLKYLGSHQAIDVVLKVSDRIKDLESQKKELEGYENLIKKYNDKSLEIKKNFIEFAKNTDEYLEYMKDIISVRVSFFRNIAKKFYPNNTSGITIYNNQGENQIRFDIDAKIESDNSDGINNVKIFCYDMTILFKGIGHKINFVFHDSRLFDGIDERQKSQIFKILNELFSNTDYQYIATINQNQLNEIKALLTEEEYESIILNNKVLKLSDNSHEDKLLGTKIDVGYK